MRAWPPATTWACASTRPPSPCSTTPPGAPCGRRATTARESSMADLRLDSVSKRFGAVTAVQGLDLAIASGDFIVLLGPSGAGKTTTLRLVAGLERPDQGRVHIGGRDVTHEAPALRDVT